MMPSLVLRVFGMRTPNCLIWCCSLVSATECALLLITRASMRMLIHNAERTAPQFNERNQIESLKIKIHLFATRHHIPHLTSKRWGSCNANDKIYKFIWNDSVVSIRDGEPITCAFWFLITNNQMNDIHCFARLVSFLALSPFVGVNYVVFKILLSIIKIEENVFIFFWSQELWPFDCEHRTQHLGLGTFQC